MFIGTCVGHIFEICVYIILLPVRAYISQTIASIEY